MIDQMFDHAVIDSFVMAAENDKMRFLRKLRRQLFAVSDLPQPQKSAPVSSPSPALRQTARHPPRDVCPSSNRADYEYGTPRFPFPAHASSCSRLMARDRFRGTA